MEIISRILIIAVITGLMVSLMPEGGPKKIAMILSTVIMAVAILGIVTDNIESVVNNGITEYKDIEFEMTKKAENEYKNRMLQIVRDECSKHIKAYIENLAEYDVEVKTEAAIDEHGNVYITKVRVDYPSTPDEDLIYEVMKYISDEFRVPANKQIHNY